jgi:hypothetical protein
MRTLLNGTEISCENWGGNQGVGQGIASRNGRSAKGREGD